MIEYLKIAILLLGSTLCAYTDYKTGYIYDYATYPMIAIGIILSFLSGMNFFITSIIWGVVTFAIGFVMYKMGGIGGGDVKLFTAISILMPISINIFQLVPIPFVLAVIFISAFTSMIFYPFYYLARLILKMKINIFSKLNMKDSILGIILLTIGIAILLLNNPVIGKYNILIAISLFSGGIYYILKTAITENFFVEKILAEKLEEDELISWEHCSEDVKLVLLNEKKMLDEKDITKLKSQNLEVAVLRNLPKLGPFIAIGVIASLWILGILVL